VAQLAENPAALRLGGSEHEVTVTFADLSSFTALSGKVAPEDLMRTTNQYLAYIVEQAEAAGGYVDKFIGDAVLPHNTLSTGLALLWPRWHVSSRNGWQPRCGASLALP
jgi:class 3 adenylate cyclase